MEMVMLMASAVASNDGDENYGDDNSIESKVSL